MSYPKSQEHDEGASINYHDKQDEYTVQHEGCDTLLFERVGGLYYHDASNPNKVIASNIVKENKLKYTKRQGKKAEQALRIRRRLFFPSDEAIPKLNSINNIPITRQDMMRSIDIFGRDRNAIRGKLTDSKTETVLMEPGWKPNDQLPFPDDIIARCNHLASKQGKKLRVLPFFSRGEPRDEDENSIAEMSDHELFGHDDAPSSSDSDEDASVSSDETNTDDPNGDHINLSDNHLGDDDSSADPIHYAEADRERMLDMQNPTGPYETVEPDNLYVEQPIATEPVHQYSTRSKVEATTHEPYKEGKRWVNIVQRKRKFKKAMWHAQAKKTNSVYTAT